jgi:hypothetical protein
MQIIIFLSNQVNVLPIWLLHEGLLKNINSRYMTKRVFFIALCVVALLSGITPFVQAQTTPLKGKVTNETGGPLAGASVMNRTTGKGTATNDAGEFTIAASSNDELVITATGYGPFEIKLKVKQLSQQA